jgi:hypothetical protein
MRIPDYLIYDEIRRREEEQDRDGGLVPLHLPLYAPEYEEQSDRDEDSDENESNRGVIIIDMSSFEDGDS